MTDWFLAAVFFLLVAGFVAAVYWVSKFLGRFAPRVLVKRERRADRVG